ncbi:MAG: M48 family metallopeptidase [bacterium]|nr:M48 family metallopeptidase [bacterium]
MTMDFFEAQECARRNTVKLMLLFGLAIVVILAFTNLVLYYSLYLEGALYNMGPDGIREPSWGLGAVFWINLAVLVLILGGTVYKISALSSGGDAVAAMLDGVPIFSDDPYPERKQLLNIVEEMAIASGVPVPQVYVLPEPGINAFAAGFEQSDTVIGVTAGALQSLNREQLQGVIAHEFSHILSGDMRLNVRLAGVLHGIMLLGLVGRNLCYSHETDDYGRRKSSFSLSLAGIGLIVIGYAGYLCGRIIKAAICRQREYLADAAAVQFTRNPQGIGGALLQIGASRQGGLLRHHKSEQMSHAFFSNALPFGFFSRLWTTHPPLAMRIHRILPDWNGEFPTLGVTSAPSSQQAAQQTAGAAVQRGSRSALTLEGAAVTAASLVGAAGTVNEAHVATARILNTSFPEILRKATHDPFAARALIFFLLLDEQAEVREKQLQHLKNAADRGVYAEIRRLAKSGVRAATGQKIPLVDLALPRLRSLSPGQARLFLDNLQVLIRANGRISLFEWCLAKMVRQYVAGLLPGRKPAGRPVADLEAVADEAAVLFSAFSHLAAKAEKQDCNAEELFAAARAEAGLTGLSLLPATTLGLGTVDKAVDRLAALVPSEKARLLRGCVYCLCSNTAIPQQQWELLRGLCAALAVPMPPMSGSA